MYQLTQFEQSVRDIVEEATGYTITKDFDSDEDCYYYNLIDQYGDVDGDPFYDFDDVLDYVENNDQVADELQMLLSMV
jgi:hypothetical protein